MNLAQKSRDTQLTERIIYKEEKSKINNETGEIVEEVKHTTTRIPKEPNYIKVYIQAVGLLHNLPNSADKILFELIKYVNYDNEIIINKNVKERIAERLNISLSRVNMYISDLTKKNFLIRKARGVYILNPYVFGKGNWKDIYELRKALQLNVIFKDNEIDVIYAGEVKDEK